MHRNFIYIKKKAIKNKHSDEIIKFLNTNNLHKFRYYGGIGVNCYEKNWFKDFCVALEEYKNKHKFLGKGNIDFWKVDNNCNYQKYEIDQNYSSEHCEHGFSNGEEFRVLAWMFYCNTIKEGGETRFPQQNINIKPEKGTLLIWPAGWTHSHLGLPAKKENKYIVTGWCSYIEQEIA